MPGRFYGRAWHRLSPAVPIVPSDPGHVEPTPVAHADLPAPPCRPPIGRSRFDGCRGQWSVSSPGLPARAANAIVVSALLLELHNPSLPHRRLETHRLEPSTGSCSGSRTAPASLIEDKDTRTSPSRQHTGAPRGPPKGVPLKRIGSKHRSPEPTWSRNGG